MVGHEHQKSRYSAAAKLVFNAVADWLTRYRSAIRYRNELAEIDPNQIAAIAKDLGITAVQLRELANKGPHATDTLRELLVALDVDPKTLDKIDARVARDIQWLCINCANKSQCKHELSIGTAADTFREFCPNAIALDEIFDLKAKRTPAKKAGPLGYC